MSHFQYQVSLAPQRNTGTLRKIKTIHNNVISAQRPGYPRVQTGQSSLDTEKVFQISSTWRLRRMRRTGRIERAV